MKLLEMPDNVEGTRFFFQGHEELTNLLYTLDSLGLKWGGGAELTSTQNFESTLSGGYNYLIARRYTPDPGLRVRRGNSYSGYRASADNELRVSDLKYKKDNTKLLNSIQSNAKGIKRF